MKTNSSTNSSAAARSKRRRERERLGLAVVRVELDLNAFTDAAIDAGLVSEGDDSREAVERAAAEIIGGWVRMHFSVTRDASNQFDDARIGANRTRAAK